MPLPVISGVYRVSIPWQDLGTSVGVRPVNVLHIEALSGPASTVATNIASALSAHGSAMFDTLYTGLTMETIQVLPLDGTSAAIDEVVPGTVGGGGSGGVLPQVCTVVSLKTATRGSRGRGRVFVGPMGETQVSNGVVATASLSTMGAAWPAFQSALVAASPSMGLVVASYEHGSAAPVTSFRIDTIVGTQRRRVNQLR